MSNFNTLTAQQQRFVEQYLIDLCATQAAIRAGYSVRSADTLGPRLVRNSGVAAAIESAVAERVKRTNVSQDSVIAELSAIAFSNMRTYAEWGPDGVELKDSAFLDGVEASCVAEVSQTRTAGGESLKFKLHDKVAALKLLGQHVGLFAMSQADQSRGYERAFVVLGGQRVYF